MVLMSILRERQFQPETEIYALNKKGELCIFELKCSLTADKYVPMNTNLLFIAEAPPSALERYFYFEDVQTGDSLWIELMKALYSSEFGVTTKNRSKKKDWLTKFKNDGYRLIDALKEPVCKSISGRMRKKLMTDRANEIIKEVKKISPKQVLLIKVTVFDALHQTLLNAGIPVVCGRLPFPGSGQQKKFQEGFRMLVANGKLNLTQ